MSNFFDETLALGENVESYFKVKKSKEKQLDWLKATKDLLLQQAQNRHTQQRIHLAAYRGQYYDSSLRTSDRGELNRPKKRRIKKFIVNHIHDITETKVSQMTRLKPDVDVMPTHNEFGDRGAAKVTSYVVKNINDANNLDDKIVNMHRQARIFGESFLFVTWDKEMGDNMPAYVEAKNQGLKKIVLSDGTEVSLDKAIKTGDVKYELELPWRVLLQRKECIDDCEYLLRIKIRPVDEVSTEFGIDAKELQSDTGITIYDIDQLQDKYLENHIATYEFYHKKTKYVPEGKKITFCDSHILGDIEDLNSTDGLLPMRRLTDLDIPGQLNGVSKYEFALPVQRMYDDLSTLIAKNIYLTAHAKWMTPRGACDLAQLGNDNTIVQFQGPIAPQLVQVMPNPPEVYSFRENCKNELQVLLGNSNGISRGEVPKGITAASALQYLNELESDRASTEITKHARLVTDIARMAIVRAADNYDVADERLIRIVGKNNKFLIRHFDSAVLSKPYDVKFQSSGGLPETKAAKMERILQTQQQNPTLFSPERWQELLEFGEADKMVSLATSAIQSADSENEDILARIPVMDPEEYEDHIAHWQSHAKVLQSRPVKEEADNDILDGMKDHIYKTEELIILKMQTNPLFSSYVAQLKLFPLFHHKDMPQPVSREQATAEVNGATNKGEATDTMIPGVDIEGGVE